MSEVFEVRSYIGDGGDYRVHCKVELDATHFCDNKFPAVLILPDGLTSYRYGDYYAVEDGYYVKTNEIVKERKYLVYERLNADCEWQLTTSWQHSLNSAIKCERYIQRMKGYQSKRELVA